MNYCPNCGKKIENEVFCSECGAKIEDNSFISDKEDNNIRDIKDNETKTELWNKYCRNKIISTASLAVFVLCIFGGIFFNYEVKTTQKRAEGITFRQAVMVNGEVTILDRGTSGVLANNPKAKKIIPLYKFIMFLLFFLAAISFIYGIYLKLVSIKLKRTIKSNNNHIKNKV